MHAFDILGDPVRRRIVEVLADGEQAAGDVGAVIQREFGISQPAVSQHLKVLKDAGLVSDAPLGTRRVYRVDPDGLEALRSYLDGFWNRALKSVKAVAERPTKED